MELKERIAALGRLGEEIQDEAAWLIGPIERAYHENGWFTPENSWKALRAIKDQFLNTSIVEKWADKYGQYDIKPMKKVGLVLAGNIPMVGFHDVLCTFVCGHQSMIKTSSKDSVLLKTVIGKLIEQSPSSKPYFEIVDQLRGFEAVIATGSNNSARYFEQYFGKYPNIIRKNRSAIGILDGSETDEELLALGEDIFNYFGLGCRNVSKIYVPADYDFDHLLEVLHEGYKDIILHNKYKNNFDYNNALFLMNKVDFLMSGSLIITEAKEITSRIATLHYERYTDLNELGNQLASLADQIQCAVSKASIPGLNAFNYGEAQRPSISDYADGVDTMEFLKTL
ncbi:MAG: acyl-CoA reductase [Bacteroidota bacterium]